MAGSTILFFAVNNVHINLANPTAGAIKDARGSHKRGDPIALKPDTHKWGRKEIIPPVDGGKFVRVNITDVTPEQIEAALQNRWGLSLVDPEMSGDVVTKRKALSFLVDNLPINIKQALNTTGVYTTNLAAIKNYIRNKRNSETL